MTATEGRDTKARILDAAEELFADHGYRGTSLRQVTSDAAANLAAVHYHFGSKEALFEAVLSRRLTPLNHERLALLEAAGARGPVDLEAIIEAFLGPALRLRHDAALGGPVFMRLLGHTLSQPDEHIREVFAGQFKEIVPRFIAALSRCLPSLSRQDLFWRFLFMIGAMAHTMAMSQTMPTVSSGICDSGDDVEAMLRRLVPFIAAGLRAPVTVGKTA